MQVLCFAVLAIQAMGQISPNSTLNSQDKFLGLIGPVSFSGSGCLNSATSTTSGWDVTANFSDFVANGQNTSCKISVPINLEGGCLVELLQATTTSGVVNTAVNLTFDDNTNSWCS